MSELSFTRPRTSPCLARIADADSAAYEESLALIRKGAERLRQTPRLDMPDFLSSSPVEIEQEERYRARQELEAASRAAIVRGEKHYSARTKTE